MDRAWSVHVIIPVFNGWDQTRICLDAVANSSIRGLKVIVADHGSTDETRQMLTQLYPQVRRIGGSPDLWWTGATNLGIKAAIDDGATHLILLNNDSYVEEDTIAILLKHGELSPHSIIAPTQKNMEDGSTFVPAATTCFLLGFSTLLLPAFCHRAGERENTIRARLIMGARGVLLPKTVIERVGLFNEDALPHYGADHDFYLRCRDKGIPLRVATDAVIHIDNSKTTLARDYANMSVRDFVTTLKDRRSHRNVSDLASLFRLHYPIKRLYWIGVWLNLVRHAAAFGVNKLWNFAGTAVVGKKRSAQHKSSSNQ